MASRSDSEISLDCAHAYELGEGREGLKSGGGAVRVRSRTSLDQFALLRAEYIPSEPVTFEWDSGDQPLDVIGTTHASLILVSMRFVDVLRQHSFTGWTTWPALIQWPDGGDLGGYRGIAVLGRCGPIDDSLSDEVVLPPPVAGGRARRALRGLCFAPDSWDGSHIFTCDSGGGAIFVTEAVREAVARAHLTNVSVMKLADIERTWRADGSLIDD